MKVYQNFVGIDIGKWHFMVSVYGQKTTIEYENTAMGIAQFIKEHKTILPDALCVAEATGGYELELLYALCEEKYSAHRADARKVKNFIRSFGSAGKTDALDAKALGHYGKERSDDLAVFLPSSTQAITLFHLVQRRTDLKQMLVAEKNRLKSPGLSSVKEDIQQIITLLSEKIEKVTEQIKVLVASDPVLTEKLTILKSVPGIGDIVAFELLIRLPELGQLTRKKIASLAGLAPRANESGAFKGYRRTGYGRCGVKSILFMAAMAARNSKSTLKEFYERLIEKNKKKMVALTALMRKILVIANARLKELAVSI